MTDEIRHLRLVDPDEPAPDPEPEESSPTTEAEPVEPPMHPKAKKDWRKFREANSGQKAVIARMRRALAALAANPWPEGWECKKINSAVAPKHHVYRIKATYRDRIIYRIEEGNVEVLMISTREGVNYDDLNRRITPHDH